jgi:sugar lactone lactonase YvrE
VGNNKTIIQELAASRDGVIFAAADSSLYRYHGADGEFLNELLYTEQDIFFNSFDTVATTADGGWVAVLGGENLVRYNPDGRPDLKILDAISAVSGDSELHTKVAVDGQGTIYALGIFNQAVFKFSNEGKYVTRWGSDGDGEGQFRAPNSIAVDGYSRVFVSDIKGIQVFASDGRYLGLIETDGVAFGLAIDDQNNLYAVTNHNKVYKYELARP